MKIEKRRELKGFVTSLITCIEEHGRGDGVTEKFIGIYLDTAKALIDPKNKLQTTWTTRPYWKSRDV